MTAKTRPAMNDVGENTGAYIPHPADTRVEIVSASRFDVGRESSTPVVRGGFTFGSNRCYALGTVLTVRVHCVTPPLETSGRVAHCRRKDSVFEIALEFLNTDDAYATRMAEQICHIRRYQREALAKAGRVLSMDEAAREWIQHFGAGFPGAPAKAAA